MEEDLIHHNFFGNAQGRTDWGALMHRKKIIIAGLKIYEHGSEVESRPPTVCCPNLLRFIYV